MAMFNNQRVSVLVLTAYYVYAVDFSLSLFVCSIPAFQTSKLADPESDGDIKYIELVDVLFFEKLFHGPGPPKQHQTTRHIQNIKKYMVVSCHFPTYREGSLETLGTGASQSRMALILLATGRRQKIPTTGDEN